MKLLTLFTLAVCISLTALGQSETIRGISNAYALEENRYEGIQGDPFLFAAPVEAIAVNKAKGLTDKYMINYNGHTGQIEFHLNGEIYELDQSYYDEITVASFEPGEDYPEKYAPEGLKFVKGLDKSNPDKHQILLYANAEISFYKEFNVRYSERKINDPSRGIITKELFYPSFQYKTVRDGKVENLKLKKENILEVIDNKQVADFAGKNKLKLKDEKELMQVLNYYAEINTTDEPSSDAVALKTN